MDWGIINTILAIIFGIATLVLAVIAINLIRRKKPVWAYTTEKIIGLGTGAPAELKLVFNDKQILDVYRTEFIFFNRGNTSIRKNDVSDAITVHFSGAEFLRDPYAMRINRHENRIDIVNRGESSFEIDFFFLDHNDGVVVEIMHTKCDEVVCKGNVIDAEKLRCIGNFVRRLPEGHKLDTIFGVAVGALLIWGWGGYLSSIIFNIESPVDSIDLTIIIIITSGFAPLFIRGIYRLSKVKRFPSWSRIGSKKELVM